MGGQGKGNGIQCTGIMGFGQLLGCLTMSSFPLAAAVLYIMKSNWWFMFCVMV